VLKHLDWWHTELYYILAVPFKLVFRVATAALCHRNALEVSHQKTDSGLELLDVRALHLLDDERWTRTVFLQHPQPTSPAHDSDCRHTVNEQQQVVKKS